MASVMKLEDSEERDDATEVALRIARARKAQSQIETTLKSRWISSFRAMFGPVANLVSPRSLPSMRLTKPSLETIQASLPRCPTRRAQRSWTSFTTSQSAS